MNLGIERFLILGCIAVLILELPQLVLDVELGDGFPGSRGERALAAEALIEPAPIEVAREECLDPLAGDILVGLVASDAALLPATSGL
jgi:hypothetical protein